MMYYSVCMFVFICV